MPILWRKILLGRTPMEITLGYNKMQLLWGSMPFSKKVDKFTDIYYLLWRRSNFIEIAN
jgi:hypothetical protein